MKVLILASPIIVLLFFKMNSERIMNDNEEVMQKYSPLIEGFRVESKFIYFMPMFFIQRIVYALVLVGLFNYPVLQLIVCIVLPCFNIWFVKYLRIYRESASEKVYMMNEVLIFIVFCLSSGFFIGSGKEVIGSFIVYVVVLFISAGVLVSFCSLVRAHCDVNRDVRSSKIATEKVRIDKNSINDNSDIKSCDLKKSFHNRTNLSMSSIVVEESPLKV